MVGAKASGRIETVAVASRDRARGEAFAADHGIARVCGYDELLADPAIDAIYNPLPNNMHAAWSIAAARAGKHVLCEKPLAFGEAEAAEMFAAAEAAGVVLVEAFPYWFQPQTLALERLIHGGAIGEVRLMLATFGFTMTAASHAGNIRLDPARGGGALLDAGCYPVSWARQVFGARPTRVSAVAQWTGGVDQTLAATLEFPGGGLAQISCSFATALHRQSIIMGSAGVIETDYHNHTDREPAPAYRIRRGIDAGAAFETVAVPRENGFKVEIDAFAELVERREAPEARAQLAARRAASLDVAWTLQAILDAARPS